MTAVVPPAHGAPRPRRGGFGAAFALSLSLTLALVFSVHSGVLPDPTAGYGYSGDDGGDDDVPFTDPVRLQQALDAAVADVGSARAAQVVVEDGEFSAVLFDPATNLWSRYQEYSFDLPGDGRSEPLPSQPPEEAEFALDLVSGAGLTAALATGNRAIGNDPDDVTYLLLVAERPFPAYGDVVLAVSDRYSSGARAWLSPDGTVLRAEVG
ncbi:hypothetical protein [Klenkia taihuensis]|uniref:Uncharacterized protein n=1 Tax=Klenkia taihuensis TaxID=1225127 RepID=A0A1I1UZ37_9ACTN|nr:hypothetical protein [Klenkia taihuensis]GHE13913.1 hypothetical protein GCM10011381_38060 [Klenkia taihuensis]SFD73290.1 hypothetical protein SAMN05661030_4108 [Klenkia taihuensis]